MNLEIRTTKLGNDKTYSEFARIELPEAGHRTKAVLLNGTWFEQVCLKDAQELQAIWETMQPSSRK